MSAFDPLRTLTAGATMPRMRLTSVTANCHVFDGQVNGRPLRLLLTFDDGRTLRLSVAADGYRSMVDDSTSKGRSRWATTEASSWRM